MTSQCVDIRDASIRVADVISSLELNGNYSQKRYDHIGATIVDSVLQAGMNYKSVVFPRVQSLLVNYSDYCYTTDFILLMQLFSIEKLIDFNNARKSKTIWNLCFFLQGHGIETEAQLADWVSDEKNSQLLLDIHGVGPKTIDYLKTLIGIDAIAIDRHLLSFLDSIDINIKSYYEAREVYYEASSLLDIDHYSVDRMIWTYMTEADFDKTV